MRAWLLDELNGIEHLRLAEVADPTPGPGEALLRVRYAALNPADRYLAERQYPLKPALPHILGRDGIGQVVQVGEGVDPGVTSGRRIILRGDVGGTRWGSFAELVVVPVQNLVEAPPAWSDQESAGAALVYLTAYQSLTMWGALPPAALVLVTGASGGVGVASVQLAAAMGHTVVGLSRSAVKSRKLEEIGAALVLDPSDPSWRQKVKSRFSPRRMDLAIDNVGGKLLPEVIDTLGDGGRVSLVGRLAGPVPNFNTATLFFRRLRLGGVAVGAYANAESQAAWQEILRLLARTGARPLVDSTFLFDQLPKAFERLAEGPMGKVLLKAAE